ncbi:hypothetical protein V8B97DRAFT_2025379 [Scleroderma yunnanense]
MTLTPDTSKQLQDTLDSAKLHLDDSTSGEGVLSDPLVMASDVAAQINAKDKYVKTIVSDDAPLITAVSNEDILKLAEKQEDVRTLAPLVEQDYEKARSMTSLATSLSVKILNAKLSAASPPASAPHSQHSNSDARHTDCADASAELQGLEKRIEESKGKLKAEMEEVERLRVAERERTAELGLGGLYDWLQAALNIQCSNELRLTYYIDSPSSTVAPASVCYDGADLELGNVIDAHVQAGCSAGQ